MDILAVLVVDVGHRQAKQPDQAAVGFATVDAEASGVCEGSVTSPRGAFAELGHQAT